MTYLWSLMILIGIVYGAFSGNMQEVTRAAIDSSREAVLLCISMAGVTAMWTGVMKIGEMTGLVAQLAGKLKPLLRPLFPEVEEGSKAEKYIALNFLSNFLGLGWASTSSGLIAFRELDQIRRQTEASPAMCTFLIINVSSLQLIPVNIIGYRAQYGSPNPAAIVGPAIVTTAASTLTAVIFCLLMNRRIYGRQGGGLRKMCKDSNKCKDKNQYKNKYKNQYRKRGIS